jgi:glycerol-3-phosphate cytidylyltransferase
MKNQQKKKNKIGFTCGAFDLTHAGHYLMFKECREQCDFLVVGLQTDPNIDRPEKHKPIQTLEERLIQLDSCKYIDDIIIYRTEEHLIKLLKYVKPDVRFLGADWKGKRFTGDKLKIKVVFNSRDHNYSTSNLRKRIYENCNR